MTGEVADGCRPTVTLASSIVQITGLGRVLINPARWQLLCRMTLDPTASELHVAA